MKKTTQLDSASGASNARIVVAPVCLPHRCSTGQGFEPHGVSIARRWTDASLPPYNATTMPAEPSALALFDALCERRVRDFFDAQLIDDLMIALAVPGRTALLVTEYFAPSRQRVLARLSLPSNPPVTLGEAIPAGVMELITALLPSLPPPPRAWIEEAIGSQAVRTEVRRLLDETMHALMERVLGKDDKSARGPLAWARAATAAGRGVVGAIGGALGADLESKLRDAVDVGVGLAQRRIVDTMAAKETAQRVGREAARLLPKIAAVPESKAATLLSRGPHALIEGLVASVVAHNAARAHVRAITTDEVKLLVDALSAQTIGDLLDRYGLRLPLRAYTERNAAVFVRLLTASMLEKP